MPLHDWTRVTELCFLDQHLSWTVALCQALNSGLLPKGYFALIQPDAVLVKQQVPPARRIEIQHAEGRPLIAVVEVVAPAYKADAATVEVFVKKTVASLKRGVHVTIVDVVPDPAEFPGGFLEAISARLKSGMKWHAVEDGQTHTAFVAATGGVCTAHARPYAIGAVMPSLRLYLTATQFVALPLEEAYQTAWVGFPKFLRAELEASASQERERLEFLLARRASEGPQPR